MRVLMIGPFAWAPKGTVSARAFLIGQALVRCGHQVTILIPPYDNPSHSGYEMERDGVLLLNVRMPSWGDSTCARLTVPLGIARRASFLQPDVIHTFKPIGYSGLAGFFLRLFWSHLPLVVDSDDWEGRGGWADIKSYPTLGRGFIDWQESWLARRADVVTVASRILQGRMWSWGISPERVIYLPNGPSPYYRKAGRVTVEEQRDLRQALGIGDAPFGLYIGHITYGSEVDLIIQALPKIIEMFQGFRVVIIGSGKGIPRLREQADRMGLAKHLVFTGWVDQQSTPAYLAAANLALYPYRDTLVNRAKSPSKITAYMAMGKPIVASAVGEIAEYLDGGFAGLLVEPDDADGFAEGVITLLREPDRAAELGRRAERRIWERYAWSERVSQIEMAYRMAVQCHI